MRKPTKIVSLSLLIFVVSVPVFTVHAQDDERKHAFQLYHENKVVEALPLFEKLATSNPWDRDVVEALGFLLLSQAVYTKDPAARKAIRLRGRDMLLRAEQLGSNSALLKNMIASIPADGSDVDSFSAKKEVEDVMREGEAAFAKQDYPKAIEFYQRALVLDPKQYAAALFTGDAYYSQQQIEKAYEWYAKAVAIDPNRETAYRYWGDVLMKQGKMTEARDKFVEAYIAEPYNRLPRAAFVQWAEKNNIKLTHPEVEIPTSVTSSEKGNTTINLDPKMFSKEKDKDPSIAAWMMYGLVRAGWPDQNFAKQYPTEKEYRHSLKEETAALRAAIEALPKKDNDLKKVDPSLLTLKKLNDDGVLEAYVLLARPDDGISHDFLSYRQANVDKLRRYVVQYVIGAH